MDAPKLIAMLQKKEFSSAGKLLFRYLVSVPPTYDNDPSIKWPTVLFLHGAGECAKNDLELAKKHGIPRLVQVYDNWKSGTVLKEDIIKEGTIVKTPIEEKDSSKKPLRPVDLDCAKFVAENFITITPQVDPSKGYGWKPTLLGKLLDEIENDYRVNKDKVYVTGVSMGGFGTFNTAVAFPHRFAGIIPICGGAEAAQAGAIKDIPTWVFHGEKDYIVPIDYSEQIVTAMERLGANVKFTRYPEADHDSWTDTYNNIKIYKWLLEQQRTQTA